MLRPHKIEIMILTKAREKIDRFNKLGIHYNIVADYVYEKRRLLTELFDTDYLPYLVAALISFDLERMMGQGAENKYDIMAGRFATILHKKLSGIRSKLRHLTETNLAEVDLQHEKANIEAAYQELSAGGKGGLNQKGGEFHVGATKILHFISPELFLIVDSNAARAFKRNHDISYRNTTQPGYTSEKYLSCMSCAKADIIAFGLKDFYSLEPGTPMARIYDKLTFATGSDWP
jgi:hypothetical protein